MKYFILFIAAILLFTAPAAHAAPCSNPSGDEGDQVYNTTYHVMQYCNGSHWVAMGSVMGMGDNLGHHTADQALDMSGHAIHNLAAPANAQDAVNKQYADTELNKKLDKAGGAMTGTLSLSGAPTANAHATTKEYVDNVAASARGPSFSVAGKVATSANDTTMEANAKCHAQYPGSRWATTHDMYYLDPIEVLNTLSNNEYVKVHCFPMDISGSTRVCQNYFGQSTSWTANHCVSLARWNNLLDFAGGCSNSHPLLCVYR